MTNLFDMIPEGFFNLLSSGSNSRVYADCLELIYDEFSHEISYRARRERIRDILASYFLEHRLEPADQLEPADASGDGTSASAAPAGLSPQDTANAVLRRFTDPRIGWLEEDNDDETYERHIVMTESGIRLAELMITLKKPEKEEYTSYIFAIRNSLLSREQWEADPYVNVLRDVYRNARLLSKSLKRLSTFIKNIIQDMVQEQSLESLTENLLSYCEGDFIREYARLSKQQNIRIYRRMIQEKLDHFRDDEDTLEQLTSACAAEEELSEEGAREHVLDMIQGTRQFLSDDYDQIMRDIKHKINLYLTIAIGRARFLRSRSADARGSVEQAVRLLVSETEATGLMDELPEEQRAMFLFDQNDFLDEGSLRYPGRQLAIRKSVSQVYQEMTEEDIAEARRAQEKAAANPYSLKRVGEYIEEQMGDVRQIEAEQLPMNSRRELLMALAAAVYGQELGYEVIPEEGYVESQQLMIRNFAIRRRTMQRSDIVEGTQTHEF